MTPPPPHALQADATPGHPRTAPRAFGTLLDAGELKKAADHELAASKRTGRPLSLMSIAIDSGTRSDSPSPAAESIFVEAFTRTCAELGHGNVHFSLDNGFLFALFPSVGKNAAIRAAERLRTSFSMASIAGAEDPSRKCTVSIGCVTTRTGRTTFARLRSRADAKRDDAVQGGGNRVVI